MTETYSCPVCGFPDLPDPPRTESGSPSWEYCDCCGFQFGVTDDDRGYTYATYRAEWVAKGMPWTDDEPPPPGWDPVAQLARVTSIN